MAAERGFSVMIVDRRRSVGMPARCAGYVPDWLRERTGFDDSAVLQHVDGIRLKEPGTGWKEVKSPGYVLDRMRLDKTLAIRALEAGADLANALVLRCEKGRVIFRRNGLEAAFGGKIILGTDGPGSVVGRSIGQRNQNFLATLQYEVGLRRPEAWVEFHSPWEQEDCCMWFVPSGRTARIGVAVRRERARFLKENLQRFLRGREAEGRVYARGILGCTGGLVPIDGMVPCLREENIILAGGAGGISVPFGGGGISTAVVSGEFAGNFASDALSNGREVLSEYDTKIREHLPPGEGKREDLFEQLARRVESNVRWRG